MCALAAGALLSTACSLITSVDRTLIEDPQPPAPTTPDSGVDSPEQRETSSDGGSNDGGVDGGALTGLADAGPSGARSSGDSGGPLPSDAGPSDAGPSDAGPSDAGLQSDADSPG